MAGGTFQFWARDTIGKWQLFTISWDGKARLSMLQDGKAANPINITAWQTPLGPDMQKQAHAYAWAQRDKIKSIQACAKCTELFKTEVGGTLTIHYFKYCPDCGHRNLKAEPDEPTPNERRQEEAEHEPI